jgi:hypothetical protein
MMRSEDIREMVLFNNKPLDYIPHRWWGVFSPVTKNRLLSDIDYDKFLSFLSKGFRFGKADYVFINDNKEVWGRTEFNLLSTREYSIDTIQEISFLLNKFPGHDITLKEITREPDFISFRLHDLSLYYYRTGRDAEAKEITEIIESLDYLKPELVTITNEPNLFAMDNKLHPDIISKPIVRRVLYGFVSFRRLEMELVIRELTKILKGEEIQRRKDLSSFL